jgi:hypothetical protein
MIRQCAAIITVSRFGSHKEHLMIRYALGAAFALLLCTLTILAAEYKGVVKSVDTDKGTITLTVKVDDKDVDKTFKYDKDKVKVTANKKGEDVDVKDGLGNKMFSKDALEKKARMVKVTTEGEKEKEIITKVYVNPK